MGMFVAEYDPTISDSFKKQLDIEEGYTVLIEFGESVFQPEYQAMNDCYINTTDGVALIYDLTSKEEVLSTLQKNLRQIQIIRDTEPIPVIVVGTKGDLIDEKNCQNEDLVRGFCNEFRLPHFCSSSKGNVNVTESFVHLCRMCAGLENYQSGRQVKSAANKTHSP